MKEAPIREQPKPRPPVVVQAPPPERDWRKDVGVLCRVTALITARVT